MHFATQLGLLDSAFEKLSRQSWLAARQVAMPVIREMNREIHAATRLSGVAGVGYERLYLNHDDFLLVLRMTGFASTSLDSVTAISWNKYFHDPGESRTIIGSLLRRGKTYSENDRPSDIRAVHALAFLSVTAARKLCRPGDQRLVVSIPSSSNSTNTLPRQLAEAVATNCDRYQFASGHVLVRARDFGPIKTISDLDERMRTVKGSMLADASIVKGRQVLLVDDLLSSGSTLREAARALKTAGASEVHALVMAKTRKFTFETMGPK